jgi:pilus assembly protein Flp/PilA
MKFIKKLLRSRRGATAIEYGLIAALISLSLVAAVQGIGGELQSTFNKSSSGLAS